MKSTQSFFKQVAAGLVLLAASHAGFSQKSPTFLTNNDPKPTDKKWVLVKEMSDEFNGKKIDTDKWQISGQGWIGRAPGLFMAENINVSAGSLQINTTLLPETKKVNGKTYTHGGGYVGSIKDMTYGYYECEMRANKTFMSSTFWLINEGKGLQGCDKRTIELDIQESVGQITNDKEWCKVFDQTMNANTHSRNIPEGCNFEKGSKGAKGDLGGKVYDDFHIYGVWWKSKDEVLYFLDGKLISTVKPPADFDIPMSLRMVVETYDWNPVPSDGGMTGSIKDRTTTYNWVRTWKLI